MSTVKTENITKTNEEEQIADLKTKLDIILEVTRAINDDFSTQSLYNIFQLVITNHTGVTNFQFYIYDKTWMNVVNYGDIDLVSDMSKLTNKYSEVSELSNVDIQKYGGLKYIVPINHESKTIAVVLLDKFSTNDIEHESLLLNFIQIISNIISVSIENKKLLKKEIGRIDLNKELELASKIQHLLVPDKLPSNTLYEFAGLYIPHYGIGGDYYDVFNNNKNEIIFCIADISGKGISAALLMANLQAYLNAIENIDLNEKFIKKLNNKIYNITNGEKFITLFIAKYNILNKELKYINAGHNPPILVTSDNQTLLTEGCTILGIFEDIDTIKIGTIKLQPNDSIICYTDGLTELKNDSGNQYSIKRLIKFSSENSKLGPDVLLKNLYNNISKFKGNTLFNDDISILCCKFL